MSSELATVFYENDDIRTIVIDKQMWWSVLDICAAIEIKNSRDVFKRLDDDEKDIMELEDTIGRKQELQICNEFGLYHILLTSHTEKAKPFRRWVTHEVLPKIRKYGYYKLSVEERKNVAYKKIIKLRGAEELADKVYSKMSVDSLEAKVRSFERADAMEIEKAEATKKYPYSYEEINKLCDGDVEFLKTFIPVCEEDKYYKSITGSVYSERFSEKFKKAIPQIKKKAYCRVKK